METAQAGRGGTSASGFFPLFSFLCVFLGFFVFGFSVDGIFLFSLVLF